VNDYLRDKLMNRKGKVALSGQVMAGACAGASNVLLVNPIEVIKIRFQVAGEHGSRRVVKSWNVARTLGLPGLYRVGLFILLLCHA